MPAITAVPPVPKPTSERVAARTSMTPESNALIGDRALDYRLGKGTMAGALNDSVRYRVTGDGPMDQRSITPDSPLAHQLGQSEAGAKLVQQLRTANGTIKGLEKVENLKGFMLPRDVDAVVAGTTLGGAETGDRASQSLLRAMQRSTAGSSKALRGTVRETRDMVNQMYREGVAAWNQDGWILFRPDVARAMLTSADAYRPAKNEKIRSAKLGAEFINQIPAHEVQHSASKVSNQLYGTPGKWMEEAVAQVLSDSPGILNRIARKNGIDEKAYAGKLAHPAAVDLGWKPWAAQKRSAAEQAQVLEAVGRDYDRSQDVMRDLLKLGGFSMGSNAGLEQVKHFLQDKPAQDLPGRIAQAIARQHDIPPSRVAELKRRIPTIVDNEHGIADLRADFGIS